MAEEDDGRGAEGSGEDARFHVGSMDRLIYRPILSHYSVLEYAVSLIHQIIRLANSGAVTSIHIGRDALPLNFTESRTAGKDPF